MSPAKAFSKSRPSCLDLMSLHVHACYVHDHDGHLLRVNEPYGKSAPRFWLGRTEEGVLWRFGKDFPVDLVEDFARLCESEPVGSHSITAPRYWASYESLLAGSGGPGTVTSGPTYWLRSKPDVPSTAVELSSAQGSLLHGTLDDWIPDLEFRRPFFVSLAASRAVAVCTSVRVGELADEAGVETALGYRNQGHAATAVSGWATAVLAMDKIPLYSTTWGNEASQSVARSLGFQLFGSEFSIQ
jgi:hypothetical protein